MMAIGELAQAFLALIGVGALVLVAYGPWQMLCIDHARDVIFEVRDKVFDLAAQERLRFGDDSYEQVRSAMNAMLRLADFFSLPRLLVSAGFYGTDSAPEHDSARRAIGRIADPVLRAEVTHLLEAAEAEMIRLMVWRSPPLLIVVLLLRAARCLTGIRQRLEPRLRRSIESAVGNELGHAL